MKFYTGGVDSEAYIDTVGLIDRPGWPASYRHAIQRACPRCGAEPFVLCTNPATPSKPHHAKSPCLARLRVG